MNTKFEELNSELENVMGGLFCVDPQSNDTTSCKDTCSTTCTKGAYGTVNGTVNGVIISTGTTNSTSDGSNND